MADESLDESMHLVADERLVADESLHLVADSCSMLLDAAVAAMVLETSASEAKNLLWMQRPNIPPIFTPMTSPMTLPGFKPANHVMGGHGSSCVWFGGGVTGRGI